MTTAYNYSKIHTVVSDAVMAQVVEHILGKDEVGSSSLPNSSKKFQVFGLGIFLSIAKAMAYHQHGIAVLYLISPLGLYIITL